MATSITTAMAPQAPTPFHHQSHHHPPLLRRHAITLLAIPSLTLSTPFAQAFEFDLRISGPKDWLKDQKRKSSKYLLAPIDASLRTLRNAYLMISSEDGIVDGEELRQMVFSASRDCVPQQRSSIVQFQSNTGVEVCTFRLVLKNAASLLDKKDPVKLEAEAMLDELIRSFSSLGSVINGSKIQQETDRDILRNALMDTISKLDRFNDGIKNCLDV